jgi:L-asparaginase
VSIQDRKPRVGFIGTGGSISTVGRHSLDLHEYGHYGRTLEIGELLSRFPEVPAVADVVELPFKAMLSTAIGPAEWLELTRFVHQAARDKPDLNGIVITHGTATLEETAYFLTLSLKVDLPVVVVGAQRPPNGLSTDAGINLVNAARVAGSSQARGLGVLVMLNDEIQAAREVTKGSTFRLETFRTHDLGMLGYADPDGSVALYRAPTRRHAPDTEFEVESLETLPRVDIAYGYAGADGSVIEALVGLGAEAIVHAGFAPGRPSPGEARALKAARAAGRIVVQSSRAGSGRVIEPRRLREDGIVSADNLNPQKARVLAMLALTRTRDPFEIQRMFDTY